jgi:hypothetical protein
VYSGICSAKFRKKLTAIDRFKDFAESHHSAVARKNNVAVDYSGALPFR